MKRVLILFSSLFLIACNNLDEEQYNESIQLGLDYIAAEDYTRAQIQFEQALSKVPEDVRANSLLTQTIHYESALKAIKEGNEDKGIGEAQKVIEIEKGSEGLKTKSEILIKELQTNNEEYTYDDFQGTYATFSEIPFESKIISGYEFSEEQYIDFIPSWHALHVYEITSVKVEENKLYLDYEPKSDNIDELSAGTLTAEIEFIDSKKTLLLNDYRFYEISKEELADYNITLDVD